MWILTAIEWTNIHLSTPVALAAVAAIGYLVGRTKREQQNASSEAQARRELKRAQAVAKELEIIADAVRKSLATHHSSVLKFKDRMGSVGSVAKEGGWQDLCTEAEEMLKPTLQLAAQMAAAYDQIRQQSNNLMTFTEVRTDPLTGVSNRRALDDTLESQLAMLHRYEQAFSVLIIDIDHFKKHQRRARAPVRRSHAQNRGQIAGRNRPRNRHGGPLRRRRIRDRDAANAAGRRHYLLRSLAQRIEEDLPLTVSGGVTSTMEGDDSANLVGSGRCRAVRRQSGRTQSAVLPHRPGNRARHGSGRRRRRR